MSVSIANVNLSTDTFQNWLDKTNQVLDKVSTVVVTTAANTTGGLTSGNASVNGTFSANVIAVGESLRGGTVAAGANLAITSNVVFSGANVGGAVTNFNLSSSNVVIDSTVTTISGGTLTVTSNANFKSNTIFINTAGRLGVNTGSPDATLTVVGTANVSGNAKFAGITTFQSNTIHQSNTTLSLSSVPATGYLFFGNSGVRTLSYDGSQYVFATANLAIQGTLVANAITAAANVTLGSGVSSGVYIVGDITGNANTLSRSVTAGSFLSGGGTLTSNITLNANASAAATASVLVARDANSSFSANVVTASLSGTATQSNTLFDVTSGGYRQGAQSAASTMVCRDTNGSIQANIMFGTATAARYADLAELYLSDKDYPTGTVVKVGGDKEITAYTAIDYVRALGTISDKPAYLMNKDLEGGVPVALKGRVPVRVLGLVKKGQGLGASAIPGVAAMNAINYFAIALEDYVDCTKEGVIECVIL
jgi:hypothetical protein